jgi:hypothetical protein
VLGLILIAREGLSFARMREIARTEKASL